MEDKDINYNNLIKTKNFLEYLQNSQNILAKKFQF